MAAMKKQSQFMTPQEAADTLGVARGTVVKLVAQGDLEAITIQVSKKKRTMIQRASLDSFIERSRVVSK